MGYARFLFRGFESYLRIVVGLDVIDVHLSLKPNDEKFITHQISPGIYSNKVISDAFYTMDDHEGNLKIEYDHITMKTKLIITRFGSTFGILGFNEKSFIHTSVKFTPYWD